MSVIVPHAVNAQQGSLSVNCDDVPIHAGLLKNVNQ